MAHDWEVFLQEDTTHQNKAPFHLLTLLESKYYISSTATYPLQSQK